MNAPIPRVALWLGLASLLPIIWGVGETYLPGIRRITEIWSNDWYLAPYATLRYAEIILVFTSGVLWGFAARSGTAMSGTILVLPALPALYALFFVIGGVPEEAIKLAIGFVLVLLIDWLFARQSLAPDWWMRLRVMQTAVMVICLLLIAYAHR